MAKKKRINLALQGGGAHGAFTWGVLDRLLEDEDIEIAGISGTSAGALNGAALKAGLVHGGREGARENLDWLWRQVGSVGDLRMTCWMKGLDPVGIAGTVDAAMPFSVVDAVSSMVSPYAMGPFYRNPLKPMVAAFDYDRICDTHDPALFICATRVRTGKIKVFTGTDITTDAILASACLPSMFQAVEIDDAETGRREAFWDGGYTGNPALYPLFDPALPADIVIVNINPLERDSLPMTPRDIQNRIDEISFNSSMLRELRAIQFVQKLLQDGTMDAGRMSRVLIHMIADDALMTELSATTKLLPSPALLTRLRDAGRVATGRFLAQHKDDLGNRDSVDLQAMFG